MAHPRPPARRTQAKLPQPRTTHHINKAVLQASTTIPQPHRIHIHKRNISQTTKAIYPLADRATTPSLRNSTSTTSTELPQTNTQEVVTVSKLAMAVQVPTCNSPASMDKTRLTELTQLTISQAMIRMEDLRNTHRVTAMDTLREDLLIAVPHTAALLTAADPRHPVGRIVGL